jgi:hypothetical protein
LISLKSEDAIVCAAGAESNGELVSRDKIGLLWAAGVEPLKEWDGATNGTESFAELIIADEIVRRLGQNVRMDLGSDTGAHLR